MVHLSSRTETKGGHRECSPMTRDEDRRYLVENPLKVIVEFLDDLVQTFGIGLVGVRSKILLE